MLYDRLGNEIHMGSVIMNVHFYQANLLVEGAYDEVDDEEELIGYWMESGKYSARAGLCGEFLPDLKDGRRLANWEVLYTVVPRVVYDTSY